MALYSLSEIIGVHRRGLLMRKLDEMRFAAIQLYQFDPRQLHVMSTMTTLSGPIIRMKLYEKPLDELKNGIEALAAYMWGVDKDVKELEEILDAETIRDYHGKVKSLDGHNLNTYDPFADSKTLETGLTTEHQMDLVIKLSDDKEWFSLLYGGVEYISHGCQSNNPEWVIRKRVKPNKETRYIFNSTVVLNQKMLSALFNPQFSRVTLPRSNELLNCGRGPQTTSEDTVQIEEDTTSDKFKRNYCWQNKDSSEVIVEVELKDK